MPLGREADASRERPGVSWGTARLLRVGEDQRGQLAWRQQDPARAVGVPHEERRRGVGLENVPPVVPVNVTVAVPSFEQ